MKRAARFEKQSAQKIVQREGKRRLDLLLLGIVAETKNEGERFV